jgi:hypothetical protein
MKRHQVSGHDFSRADKISKMSWGFSPWGMAFGDLAEPDEFFRNLPRPSQDLAKHESLRLMHLCEKSELGALPTSEDRCPRRVA